MSDMLKKLGTEANYAHALVVGVTKDGKVRWDTSTMDFGFLAFAAAVAQALAMKQATITIESPSAPPSMDPGQFN